MAKRQQAIQAQDARLNSRKLNTLIHECHSENESMIGITKNALKAPGTSFPRRQDSLRVKASQKQS